MEKTRVYDLPTRLFHWMFAGLFVATFVVAKWADDESSWFSQHMLLGLILFCVTVFRVVWGLVGSRYARFSSFPLKPIQVREYFRELLTSDGARYFGHNPASAWASLTMIGLALGLGVTGLLMATGHKEAFEDAHELLANAFAFLVVAHVAGVILHSLRHHDGIAFSMIDGKKELAGAATATDAGIPSSHRIVAAGMAGIVGLFAFHICKNYDAIQSTTSVFGVKIQLAENELAEHGNEKENAKHEHNDSDNDNDSDNGSDSDD